jgi:hypothetical protein
VRERKYSVAEIDEMRGYLTWMPHFGGGKDVEDRLRTYMLNGTDPSELKAAHEETLVRWQENQRYAHEQDEALRKAIAGGLGQ